MGDWTRGFFTGLVVASVTAMSIGWFTGHQIAETWASKAIEHGAARYHPTTGEFEWIDKAEGESE